MSTRTRTATALAMTSLGVLMLSACAIPSMPPAATPAEAIDLQRFMGTWHVIAHVPCFARRVEVASSDSYALQPDGSIPVRTPQVRLRPAGQDLRLAGDGEGRHRGPRLDDVVLPRSPDQVPHPGGGTG